VHQLSDIVAAPPHLHKPALSKGPQLDRTIGEPDVDSRVSLCHSGDPQDVLPTAQPPDV
jgi:hypothetical protein